jgi:uncharacterized membrane protein
MTTPLPAGTRLILRAFAVSGAVHLVRPGVFEPLVPPALPARRALVYASGVAELVCAYGLLRRRPWAPAASAALLTAVWPGNGQYALVVQRSRTASGVHKAIAWARLPLQLPMIRAALRSPVD